MKIVKAKLIVETSNDQSIEKIMQHTALLDYEIIKSKILKTKTKTEILALYSFDFFKGSNLKMEDNIVKTSKKYCDKIKIQEVSHWAL